MSHNYSYRARARASFPAENSANAATQENITISRTFQRLNYGFVGNEIPGEKGPNELVRGLQETESEGRTALSKQSNSPSTKIALFAVLVCSVFILNTVAVAIFATHSDVLFSGTCAQSHRFSFWIHLLINGLSTAILMGTSNAMKLLPLILPKPSGSKVLWLILGFSSIPLHLLYNSAVYETIGAEPFSWAIVGPDFLKSGSASASPRDFSGVYAEMLANGSTWDRLNSSACIKTYGADYMIDRGDVILVTSNSNQPNSMYEYGSVAGAQYGTSFQWMCETQNEWYDSPTGPNCTLSTLAAQAANWTMGIEDPGPIYPIEYCLSQKITSHCWVQVN